MADLHQQMPLGRAREMIGRVVENPVGSDDITDRELSIALATVLVRNALLHYDAARGTEDS